MPPGRRLRRVVVQRRVEPRGEGDHRRARSAPGRGASSRQTTDVRSLPRGGTGARQLLPSSARAATPSALRLRSRSRADRPRAGRAGLLAPLGLEERVPAALERLPPVALSPCAQCPRVGSIHEGSVGVVGLLVRILLSRSAASADEISSSSAASEAHRRCPAQAHGPLVRRRRPHRDADRSSTPKPTRSASRRRLHQGPGSDTAAVVGGQGGCSKHQIGNPRNNDGNRHRARSSTPTGRDAA